MAQPPPPPYVRPELFDETVDKQHRSYHSAVHGTELGTLRSRGPSHLMPLHQLWVPKYVMSNINFLICVNNFNETNVDFVLCTRLRAAGLLPLARLMEGDLMRHTVRQQDRATRFGFDYPLLCALVDRWRPETHTFHLPVGEVKPTLQDSAMLLGLPCAGQAMGPLDVSATWRDEILARFEHVVRNEHAPPYEIFVNTVGPTAKWLQQFSVRTLIS